MTARKDGQLKQERPSLTIDAEAYNTGKGVSGLTPDCFTLI